MRSSASPLKPKTDGPRLPNGNKLTTSTSVQSSKSSPTVLRNDVESNASPSTRRKNRLTFNNMLMLMVDDKTKEKYCYDSLDEGSDGSVMTSKTSSTNDTGDGYKTVYSSIASSRSEPDQQNLPRKRSTNQHNIDNYRFFVRQNALQSTPRNLKKKITHSTMVCDEIELITKSLQVEKNLNTESIVTEQKFHLSDNKSDSMIKYHSAQDETKSMPCDPLLTEESSTVQRSKECCNQIYPSKQRLSVDKRATKGGNIGRQNFTPARVIQSSPSSPQDKRNKTIEVIGSAESLVGRVLLEQGLGKYCDPNFVHCAQMEMQEALEMTQEEMDLAAHELMLQERFNRNYSQPKQLQPKQKRKNDNQIL